MLDNFSWINLLETSLEKVRFKNGLYHIVYPPGLYSLYNIVYIIWIKGRRLTDRDYFII